jgi:hypothetical protein
MERRAEEQGRVIESVKYGDAEKVFEITIPIVHKLMLIVRGTDCAYSDSLEIWKRYSQKFWNGLPDFSKREVEARESRRAAIAKELDRGT